MKMKRMLSSLPLAALLLHACDNGLSEQTLEGKTHRVSFTSTISMKQQSRAIDASWNANDHIGLYMLNNSNKELVNSNVNYVTRKGNGDFEASGTPLYYPEDNSYVDFIAYYPYNSTVSTTYKVNINNQNEPKDIDLLYSNNLTERNNASVKGNLQFYHQLSRLNIQFSAADHTNINAIKATLKGVTTTADFNVLTGKLTANDESKGDVAMYQSGAMAQAILIPTEDTKGITISLTLAGTTKEVALPADITSLAAGTNYSFTIKVKNGSHIIVPDDSNATTWRETPYLSEDLLAKKNIHYINHFMPNDQKVRNYSLLYDSDLKISYWVAYPYCSYYGGSIKRSDAWNYDPKIDESLQVPLFSSYGSGYVRGHQLPSADRTRDKESNKTTFYFTNLTPQIHEGLNQDVWMHLESQVRNWSKDTDTLFIVTGASVKNNLEDKDIKYMTAKSGQKVAVPKFYYKALARKVDGQFRTIAFKLEQKSYPRNEDYMQHTISVSDLEKLTGFTYFPSLDPSTKQALDLNYWKK